MKSDLILKLNIFGAVLVMFVLLIMWQLLEPMIYGLLAIGSMAFLCCMVVLFVLEFRVKEVKTN